MHRIRGFRCLLVDHLLEQGGEQQDYRDSVFCTTISGDRVAYEWNFNTTQLFIYRMRLSGMGSDAALLYWNHGGEPCLVRKPNHIKIYIFSSILFRNNNQHPTHIGFLTRYPLIRLWNRTGSLERALIQAQGFLALMSLYNVYLCGRLVIFHSRYFIRVSQEEHAQNNSVEIDASGEPRCPSDHLTHATYSLPATTNLDATNNYADSVFLG